MAFCYISTLPKNISEQDKRDKVSSFDCDIDTIKGYLTEIANTYLLVAFRIYEINRYRSFKGKYKNIVEACQAELGFKKSTTYNMINIVETFGKPDTSGFITYQSLFGLAKFSYSQLCEMLSLSERQRLQVTPEMTVKEIREIKKDIKTEALEVVQDPETITAPESEIVQTSGNIPHTFTAIDTLGRDYYSAPKSLVAYNRALIVDFDSLDDYDDYDFECSGCGLSFSVDNLFYERGSVISFGLRLNYCPRCGAYISSKPFGK